MKIVNYMVALVVAILTLCFCAEAAVNVPAEFPMGSPEAVTNYAVSRVANMLVTFRRVITSNQVNILYGMEINNTHFATKGDIDNLARQYATEMTTAYMETNGNTTGQFSIVVDAWSPNPFASMLIVNHPFVFPESFIGTPPAFDNLETTLPRLVPYRAQGIRQAILQSTSPYGPGDTIILDTRKLSDKNDISLDLVAGTVSLPVNLMIDPERTNRITISTSVNNVKSFKVYDRQGYVIPEAKPIMFATNSGLNMRIFISGGEAGRAYKIQMTGSVVGPSMWMNATYEYPFTGGYGGWKTNFTIPITNSVPSCLFRIAAFDSWLP